MSGDDPEVNAITALLKALDPLKSEQRVRVVSFVVQKLNIQARELKPNDSSGEPASELSAALGTNLGATRQQTTVSDIRSLREEKKPRTAMEMAALVAFYLEHVAPKVERRDYITADDVAPYFNQANFEQPAAPAMTLVHAKNAGYLNQLGNGQYKLNPVGYNLVAYKMPADAVEGAATRKPKKKKAKKAAKKAGKKK